MYAKMPFGLMNAGATFQRAMDLDFVGLKDHHDHLQHLRKVFLKYRRFGISQNPKKSQFALKEGKLLDHIVSAEGVKIDMVRVEAIQ